MPYEIGFDREKYIQMQSEHIQKRRAEVGGKLYLEMGGKLFDDNHASRVLPGFTPDNKIAMLDRIKDEVEIVICFNAGDVVRQKMRADLGITYEDDVLRLVDVFRDRGFLVENVVVTQLEGHNQNVEAFVERLARLGLKVSRHYMIPGYPNDTGKVVSEDGFGRNDYVETSRDLVVMTAPGPGSGKLATCLSQVYHEHKRGIDAGYAKFETFPIWNLPLRHPVNLAYEAATVDLDDVNMIDPFHLEAYGVTTVNYNRDVEIFPVLNAMFQRIYGSSPYKSPTDMGVNMAGYCISDDDVCCAAAKQEILRRYYATACAQLRGLCAPVETQRQELLLNQLGLTAADRPVVGAALRRAEETGAPAVAIEVPDGTIITGKTSSLLGASSACLLNALKYLGGIPKDVTLISPEIIEPIQHLKVEHLGNPTPRLHTDEVLVALSICAVNDPTAEIAMQQLEKLAHCEAHSSVILSHVDENVFKKLEVNITFEPRFQTKKLFHR